MSSSAGFLRSEEEATHVALFPSAGMGHLTPFLRFASLLLHHHNCKLTLITVHPTVSLSESKLISSFLSTFPQVNHLQFHLLPLDPSSLNSDDPFFIKWETIRRSAHLLPPLLSSLSPPLSAFVYDVSLISSMIPVTETLSIPCYILFTSSALMFSFFSHLPSISGINSALFGNFLEIQGISPIPRSSIPPMLLNPDTLFAKFFFADSPKVRQLNGVLINTFDGIEGKSLQALNENRVVDGLPSIFAIGPFGPCEFEGSEELLSSSSESEPIMKWLDNQQEDSVVYVNFGSKTALLREQIREIGDGLVKSGYKFLWVVKDKKVDRDEEEGLNEVIGNEVMERIKEKGLVVKHWVDQGKILGHKAIGGFLSHCGWNSIVEAAWHGVKVLAWPQGGDQKINAQVVEESGLGIWVKNWGWGGDPEVVIKREEIEMRVKELMENQELKVKAMSVAEMAKRVAEVNGSREIMVKKLIDEWKMAKEETKLTNIESNVNIK